MKHLKHEEGDVVSRPDPCDRWPRSAIGDPDSAENIALDVLIASQARIELLALEHQDLPQAS